MAHILAGAECYITHIFCTQAFVINFYDIINLMLHFLHHIVLLCCVLSVAWSGLFSLRTLLIMTIPRMLVTLVLCNFCHPKGNLFVFVNKVNPENCIFALVHMHRREGKMVRYKGLP